MTSLRIALVFFCDSIGDQPDAEGARRLDRAIELYRSGQANKIMVSGGSLGKKKLMFIYLRYLKKNDIPRQDRIIESHSDTTATNVSYSSNILARLISSGIKIEKIWLISNFRHLRRIRLLVFNSYWYWPWPSESSPIEIDAKNVSPRFLEFVKLIATIFDPEEKSWIIRKLKEKRARKMSHKGF